MSEPNADAIEPLLTEQQAADLEQRDLYGIVGEFDNVDDVVRCARAVNKAGFKRFDVHSPFPIHGIDEAMGTRPTFLPWIVLVCGVTGMLIGLGLTIFTMSLDLPLPPLPGSSDELPGYQYLISGKPLNSLPAFIPVVFEMTILLAAFGAVFGMFLLNRLPCLYHPLFNNDRFRRVTSDRFFVAIEARDEKFTAQGCAAMLREQGALTVDFVEN